MCLYNGLLLSDKEERVLIQNSLDALNNIRLSEGNEAERATHLQEILEKAKPW